jgi:hypothetical protein
VFLAGARGRVRVSHGNVESLGTGYVGVGQGAEGATLVTYSDHRAAKKHGGQPVCHIELRLNGCRVVKAAVGRVLDLERAWRRVRLVNDLSRVPPRVLRAAQNAGPRVFAGDVADVMQRHGLDRRPVFGKAVPIQAWATSEVCTSGFRALQDPSPHGSAAVVQARKPQRVGPTRLGPGPRDTRAPLPLCPNSTPNRKPA